MPGLTFGLVPSLRVVQRCSVCDQILSRAKRDDDRVQIALFGAIKYAQCPACLQVAPDAKDHRYRQRVRRYQKWRESHRKD